MQENLLKVYWKLKPYLRKVGGEVRWMPREGRPITFQEFLDHYGRETKW